MRILLYVLFELFEDIWKTIKGSLSIFAVLLQVLYPVILVLLGLSLKDILIISAIALFTVMYLWRLNRHINQKDENGFPVPPCQLTKIDSAGFVEIIEGRQEAAIIYLSDVEEYLEKQRKYYQKFHKVIDRNKKKWYNKKESTKGSAKG